MPRIPLIFLLLFIALSPNAKEKRTYKVALSPACPYYCTLDKNKRGYIVDLLELFFKEHKINIEFQTTPYPRLYDSLKTGVSDLALFTSLDLRNFSDFIIFDVTLGVSSAGLVSRKGTTPVILDFIDLKDKILFLAPGSKATEKIKREVSKLNTKPGLVQLITGSRIHDRLIDLVALERAEYAIDDYNVLKYFYSKSEFKDKVVLVTGGGVGIGYSLHAGQVIVADGTPEAAMRLERVLTADPGMGVARHVDAGYQRAIDVAKERGVKIPMLNG